MQKTSGKDLSQALASIYFSGDELSLAVFLVEAKRLQQRRLLVLLKLQFQHLLSCEKSLLLLVFELLARHLALVALAIVLGLHPEATQVNLFMSQERKKSPTFCTLAPVAGVALFAWTILGPALAADSSAFSPSAPCAWLFQPAARAFLKN
jgi:hypothetical protein